MKQIVIALACFALMLVIASSHSHRAIGLSEGRLAPLFELNDGRDSVRLGDYRGKHVLLSLWSSADAESRIRNKMYDNYLKRVAGAPISMIGVNYDRDEDIFREISQRDSLVAGRQLYDPEGKKSEVYGEYALGRGYKSVLIDPAGKVVAIDPGTERLEEILERNHSGAAAVAQSTGLSNRTSDSSTR